jgi:hypothetical protein
MCLECRSQLSLSLVLRHAYFKISQLDAIKAVFQQNPRTAVRIIEPGYQAVGARFCLTGNRKLVFIDDSITLTPA